MRSVIREFIHTMLTHRMLLLLLHCAIIGCSEKMDNTTADPDKAKQALSTALTAWQQSSRPDDLKPGIFVQDPDWSEGSVLQSFRIPGEGEVIGANFSVEVELALGEKKENTTAMQVWYLISTDPQTTVIRDLLHP